MAYFRYFSTIAAYSDDQTSANPALGNADWNVTRLLEVSDPENRSITIPAGSSTTLFSGSRTIGINGSSEFTLALSTLASNRYRFKWTGVGAAPVFRTDRGLTNNGDTLVIALNGNSTVTVTGPSGAFTGVVAGDTVLIPGPTTGDSATPFNTQNEGYWVVMTASSTVLQLRRPTGTDFTAYAQSVPVTADSQFLAFSSDNVQIGDTLLLSSGFNSGSLGTYTVIAVSPTWVEFYENEALPATETAVPGVAGLSLFGDAKRYIRLEFNQECVVRVNGDTTDLNWLSPWEAGDKYNTGWHERVGPCWSLVVVNKSHSDLLIQFFAVE